jgi:hypothetical protein
LDSDVAVSHAAPTKGNFIGIWIGQSNAPEPHGDASFFVAGKGGGTFAPVLEGGATAGFPQRYGRTPGPAEKG